MSKSGADSVVSYWRASCVLSFTVTIATPMVFMLRPRSGPGQWVARERFTLTPTVEVDEFTDGFGNLRQRLVAPIGDFEVHTSVDVMLSQLPTRSSSGQSLVEVPDIPHAALSYLLPSRYCESDRFGDMATEIVVQCEPGFAQVETITQWVRENVRNIPLSSVYPVSATEVNQRREGVCRDLAHVCIAMCRALCIPSRLVVGYLHDLEPMDIHAWFEAYVDDQWVAFDPSAGGDARIVIARGRDAADVAVYNQFGPLLLPQDMQVAVQAIASPG